MSFSKKNIKCVINLHKKLYNTKFKLRSSKAIKEIKGFVSKVLNTQKIRIDTNLNKFLWRNGPKKTVNRLKILVSKEINILEDGTGQIVAYVRLRE
mmetsp:Transcript_18588/g.28936  ORF Transcript_18588/g.28936 Transcript_18588/m.28936 type:complete len:96 (+) Transcript_18588:1750-2037(+)